MRARGVRRIAAAAFLILAACGGGDAPANDNQSYGDGAALPPGPTTTQPGAEATTTAAPTGAAKKPTATTVTPATTTRSGSSSATTTPRTTVRLDTTGATGAPGAFARTLLQPEPATSIVIERFEQKGAEPRQAAINYAESVLKKVSGKPVAESEVIPIPGGARSWSAEELRSTADELTKAGQGGGRAVLHVLFVRGTFDGSDTVLGVAVRGDVMAIFSDSVAGSETPVVSDDAIEEAVTVHEMGHILGLVDLARKTGRADPEHPGHSKSQDSVMYWAVESSLVGTILGGGPPREFDADDLADLAALRNGG